MNSAAKLKNMKKISKDILVEDIKLRYENAKMILASRMIAEPYNFSDVQNIISIDMFDKQIDILIISCFRLYLENGEYSPVSLSMDTNIALSDIIEMGKMHFEIDLNSAAEHFLIIHEQRVELDVSESIFDLVSAGYTSDDIRIQTDAIRANNGIGRVVNQDSGIDKFEDRLNASLTGQVLTYPCKHPLKALREASGEYIMPGELIAVGGRTGMGKTYLGLNYIYHNALAGSQVTYINLEMNVSDFWKRIFQMHIGFAFDINFLKKHPEKIPYIREKWDEVKKMPISVYSPNRELSSVLTTIQKDFHEKGTTLYVVDYLQLIKCKGLNTRLDQLSEISASLRNKSINLNVPIIEIAQMSREAEHSADKRPQLSHFRGSGDIEQDATMALLLYRPEYYNITKDADGYDYPDNYADIDIAKGRETGTSLVKCRFDSVRGFYDSPSSNPFKVNPDPFSDSQFSSDSMNFTRQLNESDIPF